MTPEILSDPNALIGFGLGCVSCYGFVMVTSRREVNGLMERMLKDRDDRIAALEKTVADLQDRLFKVEG